MTKRSKSGLSRRMFLAALGAGAAAPFAARMSRMVAQAAGVSPVRLFIMYVPHGQPVEHFEPGAAGASFLSGSRILEPLSAYANQVTVLRGVSMNDGATNHGAIRTVLTGRAGGDGTDSVDATIAAGLGVTAHVLGAIPYDKGTGFSSDSYLAKHGTFVRPTESPVVAATDLFGALPSGGGGGGSPADDEVTFRREAMALSEKELEALHQKVSSLTREASKLSLHIEAVRAAKAGGSGDLTITCDAKPDLPAVAAMAGLDPLDHANFGRVLDAHLEAAAAAFVCGTARVITLQNLWVNAGMNMGFAGGPGIAKSHHDPLSHSWDAAGRVEFASVQRWFYERLAAKMLPLLAQPDPADPGKTVLDNTIIWVTSEVSDGANHNSDHSDVWLGGMPYRSYLPNVFIGGGGGYFKGGRVVTAERKNIDVLATLHEAMGVPVSTIGGQAVSTIAEVRS